MPSTWKQSLQIAFTYIGTVVGAGFASGREIIEFFVQYGTQGLIGIFLAALLFSWSGVQVMLIAHRLQASSYHQVSTYLFGKALGTLFNIVLIAVMLGTTSVLLAASGAVFVETFQVSAQIGIWFSMVCIFLVAANGLKGIHSVNSLFVPTLILFTLFVFLYNQPWRIAEGDSFILEVIKPWIWLKSPLYYVALNVCLTQAVLVPIGKESKSERPLIIGGLLGGLGIGLLLFLSYCSMQVHLPNVLLAEMPNIYMLSGVGKGISIAFALLVYAEVFSSLVANVFGLAQQMNRWVPVSPSLVLLGILGISYLISFVGFSSLLTLLYPLFGQIVVFFLLMLAVRQWRYKY
jgi:uncharacterized membrane protein YkvI